MKKQSKFLDDRLYDYFVNNVDKVEPTLKGVEKFINKLFKICDDYRINSVSTNLTSTQVHALLKKTFTHWDRFVDQIPEEHRIWKDYLCKKYEEACRSDSTFAKLLSEYNV